TLILVGALNALILPLGLSVMLLAARRRDIVGEYRHPGGLVALGWLVALTMAAMGILTVVRDVPRLWQGG
ncbi:MAG: hypothetical protein JNL44_17590, partial [Gemmatimonadetes bacterium]|nr:hypothetical protein [Gemmatimonadota bacterium]